MLPTAVSISKVIWNLPTYLIILQIQKRKVVNKQPKKGKSEKGKREKKKKEKETII